MSKNNKKSNNTSTTPSKLVLTCPVTSKTIIWYNKGIIAAKIKEAGGEDKFRAAYVSREGKKIRAERAAKAAAKPAAAPAAEPAAAPAQPEMVPVGNVPAPEMAAAPAS